MVRRLLLAAIVVAAAASAASARAQLRLEFAEGPALRGLTIEYYLTGSFGGLGDSVRTRPDVREYAIDADGAKTFKAIVYCPGYEFVLVDRPGREVIRLRPLRSLTLSGHVLSVPHPERLTIEAVYRAEWAHEFFGVLDGPVSSFVVASTPLASDGSFALTLPDLLHDPIVAARSERGSFTLHVRQTKGWNVVGRSTTIELAAEYPRDLMVAP
jgi:hypothetical protein